MGIAATGRRRTTGLRREEVAFLAGISVEYYAQIERGNSHNVSPKILRAIAEALRLNPVETGYFFELAGHGFTSDSLGGIPQPTQRDLQQLANSVSPPAWVSNHRLDFMAANAAGLRLLSPFVRDEPAAENLAKYIFLSPGSRTFFPEWDVVAEDAVSTLRQHLARFPDDDELLLLIEQLRAESSVFREKWESYRLRYHNLSYKKFNHPDFGPVKYRYQCLTYADNPAFALIVFLPVDG